MRLHRAISLACVGGLLLLTVLRQLWIDPLPSATTNAVWLALQLLPLALVAPGLFRLRTTSYLLASLVGMLYFVHGVQAGFGPRELGLHLWGWVEVGISVVLVGSACYAVRALRAAGP